VGQERLGPSYFFISLVLGPLNSLLWYVPSYRYTWSLAPVLVLQEQIKDIIIIISGITAREPQQNPVLVFSITLTQKRVRPPVSIILVLDAELASVRPLLVKGLDHSNFPSTLELACDVSSLLLQTRTETITQTPSDVQSRRAPALINTCHDAQFAPHVGANVNAG
jgi:hypothetical protein